MNILAISGSLRARSHTTLLLHALPHLAPPEINITFYQGLADLPHFTPDLDTDTPPEAVAHLRQLLSHADGVILCTPEYAFGVPGSLKNALDWTVSSGELNYMPGIAIAASPLPTGGDKALASLLLTLKALGTTIPEQGRLSIPTINKKLNKNGDIEDETLAKSLHQCLQALAQTIAEKGAA